MHSIVGKLTEPEINAVALYVSGLKEYTPSVEHKKPRQIWRGFCFVEGDGDQGCRSDKFVRPMIA